MVFIAYFLCILQDGLNALHLAVIGNHVNPNVDAKNVRTTVHLVYMSML